ncbi:Protein trichome birefringence [Quillaja saponaria]|uniref:Protein trichome birefringence n=1 Tax=Quillaja saponaria TaxID=32244 RepID=A0AAD7VN70_QUISA|nr:Protein trichome birefringence [Quillaja saponaria]
MGNGFMIPRQKLSIMDCSVHFLVIKSACQRNGRPDFEYEKWKWESMEFEIPMFNGRDMLERLRGKRVIIVGDSLNRNQWESLACLLYSCLPPSQAKVDTKSGTYKIFTGKEANQANRSKILRLDKLSSSANKWQGADIMVFNTGHWWEHRGKMRAWDLFQYDGKLVQEMKIESAFEIAMKSWAYWIDNNVDKTKTTVFFRSISPEHKGKQWCFNKTKPLIDESYIPVFPKSITDIIERTIAGMETPVKYLNITKLSQYRTDAHPTIFSRKQGHQFNATKQKPSDLHADYSHWCLPGVP